MYVADASSEAIADGDFDLTITPTSLTVVQGGVAAIINVHVIASAQFAQAITLTVPNLPTGVSVDSVVLPAKTTDATLALSATRASPQGQLGPLAVTAVAGAGLHSKPLSVFVRGCPGCLDTTFSTTGYSTINDAVISGIAVDVTGAVFLAGARAVSGPGLVVKILPDASFDTTFGVGGFAEMPLDGEAVYFDDIALDGSKIVLCGSAATSAMRVFLAARMLATGAADASFGTNGFAIPLAASSQCNSIRAPGDGSVVTGGSQVGVGAVVAAFLPTGALNTAYATNGWATLPWGSYATVETMDLTFDGHLVVGGLNGVTSKSSGVMLSRLDAAGALDISFGDAGVAAVASPSLAWSVRATSVSIDVAADDALHFGLDGTLQRQTVLSLDTRTVLATSLLVEDGGQAVFAGSAAVLDPNTSSYVEHTVVQRIETDGGYDTIFGEGGSAVLHGDTATLDDQPSGIAPYPNERAVIAFDVNEQQHFTSYIARIWL